MEQAVINILAIETSCDETAAAVVTGGREIRSNIVSSQMQIHVATGGVVPEVAARMQLETIIPVVSEAMKIAQADWPQIEAIAVTYGPGLIGPLLVGVETAKTLAVARQKPLIPVNHLAGHLYACLADETRFRFPYLGLIVSGNHTELVRMYGHHQFELLGSTRDDAAGEAFDKVGRLLGFPYPGGPAISQAAESGDPQAVDFPRAMADQDNLDFSFSGLKSAVRREVGENSLGERQIADIAASFQRAVVDVLVLKTLRAMAIIKPSAVLLGGGVAANKLLRTRLADQLGKNQMPLLATPPELATDNAAMIGQAAYWQQDTALTGEALFSVAADPGLHFDASQPPATTSANAA